MFGFSLGHLIVLLIIVLLFGGKRLPELGSSLGRGLRAFKKGIEGGEDSESDDYSDDTQSLPKQKSNSESAAKAEVSKSDSSDSDMNLHEDKTTQSDKGSGSSENNG